MEMVFASVVGRLPEGREAGIARRTVAPGADAIAVPAQAPGMGLVAVRAADAPGPHLRLKKRPVDIDLVQDLSVGVVEAAAKEGEAVMVFVGGSRRGTRRPQGLASGMTAGAELNVRPGGSGREGDREAAVANPRPAGAGTGVGLGCARPGDVRFARSVTSLASDAHLRLHTGIAPGARVVILLERRHVAFGTARIPVLVGPGPVQAVSGRDLLVRIEMVPLPRVHVPGEIEGL